MKNSLKLSESDLERVRYDMEGTRIKSQNLEKELKELKQQIFKAKVGEHKEERRIFRGKLDELKATIQEVESLISISRINEAKNKI